MVVKDTLQLYDSFLKTSISRWEYSNSVLYRMCEEKPEHSEADVIAGKILLIGRTYAAAIERRKNANEIGDDFYYKVVAPKMLEIGTELDNRLNKLRNSSRNTRDDLGEILETHKFLMDTFYELTGLEKRSLASKYLHFHCPRDFFIYDSRAKASIGKLVKRPDRGLLLNVADYDLEYADFVCRMLELQEYLHEHLGVNELPRKLDSFLLTQVS